MTSGGAHGRVGGESWPHTTFISNKFACVCVCVAPSCRRFFSPSSRAEEEEAACEDYWNQQRSSERAGPKVKTASQASHSHSQKT